MSDHKFIPHNRPTLGADEESAAAEVIRSGWIAQGERVRQFEGELARFIDLPADRAVALSSGTAALYVAIKMLDLPRNSEIIIPTYVCSALLNAIFAADCRPVLVDVGAVDFNMTVAGVKAALTDKTGVIIAPHMFGCPADTAGLSELGIPIIEDCATALGSSVDGNAVGLAGDVAVYSFYASKVIATGQGGMLISSNPEIAKRARDFREFDGREDYYPRFNFHLSDLQAAVGLVQMKRLPNFLTARQEIASAYEQICVEKGWEFQNIKSNAYVPNWYRFVLKGESGLIDKIKSALKAKNIESIVPIEKWELLHNYLKLDAGQFPVAENLSNTSLSLPIYPGLIDNDALERISQILRAI